MKRTKGMAALAAGMILGCTIPALTVVPTQPTMTTRTSGLTLSELPPTPPMQPVQTWRPGSRLLPTGVQSAYLVVLKDPDNLETKFLAYGFDPSSRANLFVLRVGLTDFTDFMGQWTIDVSAWRAIRGTSPSEEGIADGLGGPPPPPIPSLRDDRAWKHAFYGYDVQTQIAAGR